MNRWSRRDVLRRGAVAAAAMPVTALAGSRAATAATPAAEPGPVGLDRDELAAVAGQPMLVSVHDAERGEVAVYHGRSEVLVTDPALVARIVRAARTGR